MSDKVSIKRSDTLHDAWDLPALKAQLDGAGLKVPVKGVRAKGAEGWVSLAADPSAEDIEKIEATVKAHDGQPLPGPVPLSPQDDATAGAFDAQVKIVEGAAYVCLTASPGAAEWKKIA